MFKACLSYVYLTFILRKYSFLSYVHPIYHLSHSRTKGIQLVSPHKLLSPL